MFCLFSKALPPFHPKNPNSDWSVVIICFFCMVVHSYASTFIHVCYLADGDFFLVQGIRVKTKIKPKHTDHNKQWHNTWKVTLTPSYKCVMSYTHRSSSQSPLSFNHSIISSLHWVSLWPYFLFQESPLFATGTSRNPVKLETCTGSSTAAQLEHIDLVLLSTALRQKGNIYVVLLLWR